MPFRAFAAVGAAAALATAAALLAALDAMAFHLFAGGPGTALRWPAAAAALALGSIALAAAVLAVRAAARIVRAERRLRRRLATLPSVDVGGTEVRVLPGAPLAAFCAGAIRPRVVVTRGVLDALAPAELAAVVAHESHHAARRDPLRLAAVDLFAAALFFVPGLGRLAGRCRQACELAADAAAERRGGRAPLAAAMLRFADAPAGGVAAERVDRLLGEDVRLGAGRALLAPGLLSAGALLALVAAVAGATGCDHLELCSAQGCGRLVVHGLLPLAPGAIGLVAWASGATAARARAAVA